MHPEADGVAVVLTDGQELDDVAELLRVEHVDEFELLDAIATDGVLRWIRIEGNTRQDMQLMLRVTAIDVERGIGFSKAELLSALERIGERPMVLNHAREDEVGGAVDDTVDRLDAIAGKALGDGLDDWNASGDRGFKAQFALVLHSQAEELRTAVVEQGLVRGNHVLTRLEGCGDDVEGNRDPTHELDHDVDAWVVDDFDVVRRQEGSVDFHLALAFDVYIDDATESDLDARSMLEHVRVLPEKRHDSGANDSEPD